MYILRVVPCEKEEIPENVLWNNVCIMDQTHNSDGFHRAAVSYMQYTKCSVENFEMRLRSSNMDTRVIATIPKRYVKVKSLLDKNEVAFLVYFSCKSSEESQKEVLEYSKSYMENFVKLKDAGFIEASIIETEMHKYVLEKRDEKSYFDEQYSELKNIYGEALEQKKIGQMPSESDNFISIYALFVNDHPVFEFGFTDPTEPNFQMICLNLHHRR